MIVVVIVSILAAIALPAYQKYTTKARFTEIVMAATAPKTGVEVCAQVNSTLTGCSGGALGVPNDLGLFGNITSVTTVNGVITIVPLAQGGIVATDDFIMTPALDANNKVTWTISGGCVAKALCA